jgi:hypothetical protein
VRLAHQFAMESDLVTADMVEASEFPQLAMRHAVMGVPKSIVNDRSAADGMLPEGAFLDVILASARGASS